MVDVTKLANGLRLKYSGGSGGICECGRKREHHRDWADQREWRCPVCPMSQKFTSEPNDPKVVKMAEAFLSQQSKGARLF